MKAINPSKLLKQLNRQRKKALYLREKEQSNSKRYKRLTGVVKKLNIHIFSLQTQVSK